VDSEVPLFNKPPRLTILLLFLLRLEELFNCGTYIENFLSPENTMRMVTTTHTTDFTILLTGT
jgi:hypothetical protein